MALRFSPLAASVCSVLEPAARSARRPSKTRAFLLAAATLAVSSALTAQTPAILPNTITSIAGNTPVVSTTSAVCPTNSQFTATDGVGNGCPAVNATISSTSTSIAVDPLGNVYISANSSNPQIIRKIDATTGVITAYAGAFASQCASGSGQKIYGTKALQTDKTGDNCPVTYSSGFNGPVSLGTDPYGNLLIGTTGDNTIHFICNAVSPLCNATQAGENLMISVIACTLSGGTTSYPTAVTGGTTVGTEGDGGQALQLGVASCTTGNVPGISGRAYAPTADRWDNVYFTDGSNGRLRVVAGAASITVNGVVIPNPLFATLQTTIGTSLNYATPTQGNVYPIAGGAAGGTVCAGATDAGGDGCPFYQTLIATGSTGALIQGNIVDRDGDFLFVDGNGRLRVIYMGGTVIKGALAANGVASPQIGYSYLLIGNGTSLYYNSADPGLVLGKNASLQSGATQTLALDPAGNIIIGDQIQLLFYDISTGYLRRLATANGATSCNASTFGDGCPLAQSKFGATSKILPIATDPLGNLYMLDIPDLLVRRISAQTLPTTTVNNAVNTTPVTSSITVHAPVAGSTVAITAPASTDYTLGATTCTTNTATDGSVDCTAPVTYSPKLLAQRTVPVSIATTVSSATTTQNLSLNAGSTGSALVFDTAATPATTVLGATATANTAMVLDGAGNAYVIGAQGISKVTGSTVTNIAPTATAAYLAVDAGSNVYAAATSSTAITKYTYSAATSAYTSSTITIPPINICTTTTTSVSCALTQVYTGPMVVDTYGDIYIADTTNKHVMKFSPPTGTGQQLTQAALVSPTSMGRDTYGNLLVIDGTSVLKIPAAGFTVTSTSPTANPVVAFSPALAAPTSITADQAENIYVADSGNIKVQAVSGGQYTIPGVTGSVVAVDGAGILYTTTPAVAGIKQVLRNAETFDFGTSIVATYVGVFGNAGATAATGFAQTDTGGNFTGATSASPLAGAAPTCNLASTALAGGSICNISLSFTPTPNGNGSIQDAISFLPAASTIGSLVINGTKTGTNATTTTTVTGNTAGLIYTSGSETTFTVTVSESPAAVPSGTVSVVIDGGTAVNYPLTAATASTATASVPVSGLSAGSHTIVASYANSAGIVGSSSIITNFSIGQAATTIAWTPATTTQQYSAAVGTTVLNATATSPAKSGTVPGVFIYTATPSGGSATAIHSASYLPIGAYSLGVTFVPNDTLDYAGSTGTVATYTVTKASTTASVGTTQMLVAADGTGNYATVQAAVDALPSGGSVYIKPGTYNAFVSVVQPNVSLRGLGGDPTKVILTHEAGAFGSTYPYIGEFTAANSNGAQMQAGSTVFTGDEGSATLVVAKGTNTKLSSSQQVPNGFYAENLSLINTYDTDATTTTTTYSSTNNGTCVTGQPTAMTYSALFNTGQLCASQALVIWTTSDLSLMNNIFATSAQDTIYTASPGQNVPARQYWFRGKVTGDIDYIFGDAAAVFDSTSIYTIWHGATATGTETIHAQNKAQQTGGSSDYLSGYVMNNNVFTSQSTGMTNLFLGRPYGTYSTWIMLNSYIDQVNPTGYTTGLGPSLTSNTFGEYNNTPYVDPATGSSDLNGIPYLGTGGNSGSGVSGPRETGSTNPGTPLAGNIPPTSMTQAQAQAYFPTNFLSQTVASSTTPNWNPTAALATMVNGFVPSGTTATIAGGASVTILMRPQTPGLGAISNGLYTIPTGTYTLTDSFNGGAASTIASGSLDASGEAYFTSSSLSAGTHSLSWTYSGDTNFSGSATASAYVLTISGTSTATTTTVATTTPTITYGQPASVMVNVASSAGTPTGTVTLISDAGNQTATLSGGSATFSVTGLTTGAHNFSATFNGSTAFVPSSTTATAQVLVNKAHLTLTAVCTTRIFGNPNACTASANGYQYTDTAATVFASTPTASSTATRISPVGSYPATPAYTLSTFGAANYIVDASNGTLTVTGGAPQTVYFAPIPLTLHAGSYQLTARASSGLPVTYSITTGTGIASITSGTTLTVTGAGPVTIQATQTDPSTDYATANSSRSFLAQ